MDISAYITMSISLLAVLNPIGTATIYISLMGNRSPKELNSIAVRFTIAIIVITAISEWGGHYFLQLFGINLPAFEVAGGVILALIGLNMILPKPGADEQKSTTPKLHKPEAPIAVVPLAIPMAAGPGVIALIIANSEKMHSILADKFIFAGILVVLCLIMGITMKAAPTLHKKMSTTTLATVARIMGLVIAAIGMNMLANGMLGLFPGLR